jgi:hypothetical protein
VSGRPGQDAAASRIAAEAFGGFSTKAGRANPYPFYQRIRELGPHVTMPDGMLAVSGYHELPVLLRDRGHTSMPVFAR